MNVIERRNVHEPSKNRVVNDQSSILIVKLYSKIN